VVVLLTKLKLTTTLEDITTEKPDPKPILSSIEKDLGEAEKALKTLVFV